MMEENFERLLRDNLRREPFQPFVVELVDGRQIIIDAPHTVAMSGGGGTFISPEFELVSFSSDQVRAIRPALREAAS